MDLSALIFVAVAVAWAVYLVPTAIRRHEDASATRSVEGSDRMRVLARREPEGRRATRLVVPGRPAEVVEASPPAAAASGVRAATRDSARRAARRRLRVVLSILVGLATVVALGATGVIGWVWTAVPAGVLLGWLVACRLMVRRERTTLATPSTVPATPTAEVMTDAPVEQDTDQIAAVVVESDLAPEAEAEAPTPEPPPGDDGWDPVPVTLPTYVAKEPAARRSVRTIDLDSTGVWTSGRTAEDAALARQAEESERSERSTRGGHPRHASGS